jgi:cytochrome c peroxidase
MPPRIQALLATMLALMVTLAVAARVGYTAERHEDVALEARAFAAQYARPTSIPHPDGDAPTRARHELGRRLFFDVSLSGARDVSCATCHNPNKGWGDGRAKGVGTRGSTLGRRTPTVLNTAWAAALFWDGRAETLEEQALGPIQAEPEMGLSLPELVARLGADSSYRKQFTDAFGDDSVTPTRVAKAVASFERAVVSSRAPFDRWVGGDERAISAAAKRGFVLFNTKASCAKCHSGWRMTDDSFHDIGLAGNDSGRARIVPGLPVVEFAFKTPTLRNVVERAPYMHDGSEKTLAEVVAFYDAGGRVQRPSLSPEIKPLGLTASERGALVAFLRTLSSRDSIVVPQR